MSKKKNIGHPMDVLMQKLTPTVVVPLMEEFEPLKEMGHRFLVAGDGLWLEVKTAWLYLCYPLARQTGVYMPYGMLKADIDLLYGKPPIDLLQRFQAQARDACPAQTAAWITWTELSGFRFYKRELITGEAHQSEFECPPLRDGESLVFDLRSHGNGPAFFRTDKDADQREGVFISGVFGDCLKDQVDDRYRLSAKGLKLEMDDVFSMLVQ